MPLAVKTIHADHEPEEAANASRSVSDVVRQELERATCALERSAERAQARLNHHTLNASKRIIASGRRAVRAARHVPLPVTPVMLGLGIIFAAVLLSPDKRS